jgi:hypothetical protein
VFENVEIRSRVREYESVQECKRERVRVLKNVKDWESVQEYSRVFKSVREFKIVWECRNIEEWESVRECERVFKSISVRECWRVEEC